VLLIQNKNFMKKIIILFAITLFFIAGESKSQDIEGEYRVGNTQCVITASKMSFKVYWEDGTGHTQLFYNRTLNNGKVEFNEYESNGETYTGKFLFNDDSYETGEYIRNDSKKFKVYKIN
jgi:hypothetical protein